MNLELTDKDAKSLLRALNVAISTTDIAQMKEDHDISPSIEAMARDDQKRWSAMAEQLMAMGRK